MYRNICDSFRLVFASGSILLLASGAIALYLSGGARRRFVLVWCAIAAIAIAPTVLGIYLRHVTGPYEYAHDGMIQTEEAIRFVLAGKNPYAENYGNTPMALWHFQEPNLSVNPALYHLPYLPFLIICSTLFYIAAQATMGWFDERMIFLTMFVAT